MKKYLVKAETSTEPYSSEETLFAICDSKEEAIQWIRDNQTVKIPWRSSKKKFDFKKECFNEERWKNDELLAEWFIQEFDGTPCLLSAYME